MRLETFILGTRTVHTQFRRHFNSNVNILLYNDDIKMAPEFKSLEEYLEQFTMQEQLGRGKFGVVYKVI